VSPPQYKKKDYIIKTVIVRLNFESGSRIGVVCVLLFLLATPTCEVLCQCVSEDSLTTSHQIVFVEFYSSLMMVFSRIMLIPLIVLLFCEKRP